MSQRTISVQIAAAIMFMLAIAGMQYTQQYMPGIIMIFYYCVEVLMYMCILGACEAGVVPGLLACAASPVAMMLMGDTSLPVALVLTIANVLAVLALLLFKDKKLLALAVGGAARFALAYLVCTFILAPMIGDVLMGFAVADKVNLMMIVTTLIGAALYYVLSRLLDGGFKRKKNG